MVSWTGAGKIEAVELMIAAAHTDALLKTTPPEQRTDYTPTKPEEPKGAYLEQIVKLEREMNDVQVQVKYKENTSMLRKTTGPSC